jgi:hypothetical protein
MINIAAIIFPLFAVIGLGFFALKAGLVKAETLPGLGNILLFFALPATLFTAVSKVRFEQELEPLFLTAYAGASFGVFLTGLIIRRYLYSDDLAKSGVSALGMALPNSIFIGLPLLLLLFPDDNLTIAFVMAILVENILILPLALIVLEISSGQGSVYSLQLWKTVGTRLVKNPLIMAIVAGILASGLQLELPAPLAQVSYFLLTMSSGLALMFVGMTLANNHYQGNSHGLGFAVSGKLIGHPLACLLMLWILPDFNPVLEQALLILAAVPMFTIYPVIGSRYGFQTFCANTLMVATAVAFVTLVIILTLLGIRVD